MVRIVAAVVMDSLRGCERAGDWRGHLAPDELRAIGLGK